MAILDFCKDNDKSISLHFHSPELGPEGQPLYFSTPEKPAVIRGHVEFRTVKQTNGGDIVLSFEARSESKWIGVTRYNFEVKLDPNLPPSVEGRRGWFHYRFKAHLHRDFPRRDMAAKQLVWVYSSSLRADEQLQPKIYNSIANNMVSLTCTLPSSVLYQGQEVPLTVVFEPFRENSVYCDQELIVESAVVKLKQYTTLSERRKIKNKSFGSARRNEKKVIFNLPVVAEEWPQTSRGFSKTIMIDLPGARQLAASIETEPVVKYHCLKLIMKVRTKTMTQKEAKEVRVEMDVKITSPRPEHIKNMASHTMDPPPYHVADNDDNASQPPSFSEASSSPRASAEERSPWPVDIKHASGL
ncbi:hypothetical protein BGZ65_002088 [Modicella reniformis]|uniref:Arrestin C-terminal-like domain-containing protein n=1 Tax=Modicella reniformis TaxID=1440133 RepID=A0A9P6MIF6_9FUNG|nr:hypothetical protein BGZ65_002088 [Modicella reniformis]